MIDQRIGKVKLRRGTNQESKSIIFDQGELIYIIDKKRLFIGDGNTYGGIPVCNRSFIVHGTGIPSTAVYGDIVYNSLQDITYIVGYELDGTTFRLFEIANNGKLKMMQWEIMDLYNKIRPLTGYLDHYEEVSAPYVVINPLSQELVIGSNVEFSITATGTETLLYQWYKDSAQIDGATKNTYKINNIQFTNSGLFKCKVSNPYGHDESDSASLIVKTGVPPTIMKSPVSQSPLYGSDISLFVEAVGTETLVYEWYKNGIQIPMTSSNTLNINDVQSSDSAKYKCKVTNLYGTAESKEAIINVITGTIPVITTHPLSQNINNGSDLTLDVVATGSIPLSYQWYKNNILIIGEIRPSIILSRVTTSDAGLYKCKVSNIYGNAESNNANIIINIGSPPIITTHPLTQTLPPHSNVTFNVVATGSSPFTYEWYKDNNIISGANDSTYILTNIVSINEGAYKCRVSNTFGYTESNIAVLTVNTGIAPSITLQPLSQNLNNRSVAGFSIEAKGSSPLVYQWYKNGKIITGATSKTFFINNITALDAGSYKCNVSNVYGNVDSVLAVLTVNIGDPPNIITHPSVQTVNVGATATFTVVANGTGVLSYQWYKNSIPIPAATTSTYSFKPSSITDGGTVYCKVSNSFGSTQSNTANLNINIPPSITINPKTQTVISNANVTFNASAIGTALITYQWYKNGSVISGQTNPTYTFKATGSVDNGNYTCIATNIAGSASTTAAILTVNEPPVITTNPISQSIPFGNSVTFITTATGTAPLTYQWYRNGSIISGATSNMYSFTTSSVNEAGNYYCRVTNTAGYVDSNNASLTITNPYIGAVIATLTHGGSQTDSQTISNVKKYCLGVIPSRIRITIRANQSIVNVNGTRVLDSGNNNTSTVDIWISIYPSSDGYFTITCGDFGNNYGGGSGVVTFYDYQK